MTSETDRVEAAVLTSKVVQINSVQQGDGYESFVVLYALCEDGSVWEQIQHNRKSESLWRMVQPPAVVHVKEEPANPSDCPFEVGDVIISRFGDGATPWTVKQVIGDRIYLTMQNGRNELKAYILRSEAYKYRLVSEGE